MADLYFKVRADYDELVRMQQEAKRLKDELANAATKADFTKLASELQKVNEKMQDLAENGAKNFQEKLKGMDDSSPEFFKEYDNAFMKFSSTVVKRLDEMQGHYESMMQGLLDKAGQLEQAGNAPRLLEQVKEVTDQIKEQIEVIKLQKEVWSGMYDDTSISALDIIKQQREEEEKKLEILRQQLETKKAQAEEDKPNALARASAAVTDFLGFGYDAPNAQSQAALGAATQAYEAQKQVVAELKDEEEFLKEQLSSTAQAQVEEAEAAAQSSKEREAYIQKLRDTGSAAKDAGIRVEDVLQKGTAAYQALDMSSLRQGFQEAQAELQKVGAALEDAYKGYVEQVQKLRQLEEGSGSVDAIEKQLAKVAEAKTKLDDTAKTYEEINGEVERYKQQVNEASGHQLSLRTEMRQAREELARMVEEGKAGTPEFQRMAQQAGQLQRNFRMASAAMQYFANPTRHLAALKTGLQGVAGAAGLVTGAMGLFNTESKKMQEIQTKVQSLMAIIIGLETTYNAVKKTSTFMLALEEVKTLAVAAVKRVQAVATGEAAVAQEALNAAMAANPIGAVIVVLMALAAAIYAVVSAMDDEKEQMEINKAAREQMQKTYAETATINQKIARETASTFVEEKRQLEKLQKSYLDAKKAGKDMSEWVKNAKSEHDKLGLSIKSVSDAEYVYVQKTDVILDAMRLRAEQAALLAAQLELLKDIQLAELGVPSNPIRLGDKFTGAQWIAMSKMSPNGILVTQEMRDNPSKEYIADDQTTINVINREIAMYELGDKRQKLNIINGRLDNIDVEIANVQKRLKEGIYNPDNPVKEKEKKTKQKREEHHQNDEWSAEEERLKQEKEKAELEIKQAREYENRVTQAKIDLMNEGFAKRKKQEELNAKKEIEAINQRYRDMALARIQEEKAQFDKDEETNAKGKKTYKKKHYYESDKYKAHFSNNDPKNGKLKLNDDESKGLIAEIYLADLKARQAQTKLMEDYLKDAEKFYGKELAIRRKYDKERDKLRELHDIVGISTAEYNVALNQLNKAESDELRKLELEEFKGSDLFAAAMADGSIDGETAKKFKDKMEQLLTTAAKEMSPSDFKAFSDIYTKFADKLIGQDPFGTLKQNLQDYRDALDSLTTAKNFRETLTGASTDDEVTDIDAAYEQWGQKVEEARGTLLALENSLLHGDDKSEEEITKIRESIVKQTEYLNYVEAKHLDLQTQIKAADNQVANAEANVASKRGALIKSMKKSAQLIKELTDAVAGLADNVSQPIGDLIGGLGNIAVTAIDAFDKIETVSKSTAKGLELVGQAVSSAVAVLAIIQAAWQVINTIISLFQGEDWEQREIDYLAEKVKMLDYQFQNLKEDMDKAWGTEAIDKYIAAVDTLNKKHETSKELILSSMKKSKSGFLGIGSHDSLYDMMISTGFGTKQGQINQSEFNEAVNWLGRFGLKDVPGMNKAGSREKFLDFIMNMTPEQLKEFMNSSIGGTIMAKLGAVKDDGEGYSGKDWLADMKEIVAGVQDLEDLALAEAEKLNGISLDGLKDEFKSLVTTMTTSLNDINNSFDSFMRETMYNKLRTKYDEQVEDFNEELRKLQEEYNSDTGMSEEEYRKRLQELRDRWKKETKAAQDEYQASLTAAGINAEDVEQSATSGGFEAMSEDTATELNGRFAAMQAMETVTAENMMQMVTLQTNVINIADEIRTIQVNSYLELQAISENTKKIVNPILEMQENVKLIKENTDKL